MSMMTVFERIHVQPSKQSARLYAFTYIISGDLFDFMASNTRG